MANMSYVEKLAAIDTFIDKYDYVVKQEQYDSLFDAILMKESLCAHCKNCVEVKYHGFLCDRTGYIEDKTTSTGCVMFEDD